MKHIALIITLPLLVACNQQNNHTEQLQSQIDSLQSQLADTYKPGFGEFMGTVQAHHAKLWFAGINENWELADFEVDEIVETVESVQKYQSEREESQKIDMIFPALDTVKMAIQQKDPELFKSSFTGLTNTCNNCHHSTDFEFNVVKIPDTNPFPNQDFKTDN